MSEEQTCDLIIVGLGPGAESLATGAAEAGLRVVAVEKHLTGGECPYYGCVPSKMMVRAADLLAEGRRIDGLAGEATITASWEPVARRIREEATTDWDDQVAVDRLTDAGVTFARGQGRLTGERTVAVQGPDGATSTWRAERGVVLNPGTRPAQLPIPGLDSTPYWTNREAVQATSVPASLLVIGGGPIGAEMTQVFARFGARTTVLEAGPRILGPEEPEASALLTDVLAHEGVRVMSGVSIAEVGYLDGTFSVAVEESGGRRETLHADQLLVAAGRTPNLDDLGLETVGLDPTARTLAVDERLRVLGADGPVEGLWAIGDVTGQGAFTHVAMYQQAIALRSVLGEGGAAAQYRAVPHTTFTDPEVAGVGLTEQRAREAGLTVRVGLVEDLGSRGWLHGGAGQGLVKVVEDADRGVLVGASVVGPAAGEVLGFLAVAVHAEVPVATLREMIYAYPTFHRAIESALADLDDDG
ncbi:dihydrolipoyl dehydrogenase family protein [Nocardioides acrostichi]|uniref:NAD(P)/FAD-dependent oxidoreductase n=1 Tax=Nocardioides acrostichi TaxID=2784339 RepID=A0A930Y7M0_9ACTN|nr:NAD(P)/FAD-dependent oxidoreductase [Nocardioides acrostichi]MBF4162172.1 NAD(P)/FAD-dependent oxidoreductase [Nocardioides acrostichi]